MSIRLPRGPQGSSQPHRAAPAPRSVAAIPEEPLRAELFSIGQLERLARSLAEWQQVERSQDSRGDRLLARLDDNERVLADAYELLAEAVTRGSQMSPAAEWFVDNYHLIQEQARLARKHLPRGYNRALPRLVNGPSSGMPRVYDLAIQLISHSHGRVDLDALQAFVSAYQSAQPLELGELWAIPIMLRLALLENLRRVLVMVTAERLDRERAGEWATRLIEVASTEPARVVLVLSELIRSRAPMTDAFVAELTSRLQAQGPDLVLCITWIEQCLAERGHTIAHALHVTTQTLAADQVAVRNSIGSMRFVGATDWRDFVEATSVLEAILRTDPSGVYHTMDFASRDRYRHAIEAIARDSALAQPDVARRAVALAAAAIQPRQRHIGYFLIDEGRGALEHDLQARRHPLRWLRSLARRWRLAIYVGSASALAVALSALAMALASAEALPGASAHWLAPCLVIALTVFCALHLAIALVHWLVTIALAPRVLPRIDFSAGIPTEHRTAVAVPTMLTDQATIDDLVEQLEIRYLGNRDPQLWFGLLTDFRDATTETTAADDALLAHAHKAIEDLNEQYGAPDQPQPFFLCHRARKWNPREGVWMGWERKRGKLEDFNAFVRGADDRFALTVGPIEQLRGIAYVIALDSDTELPRESAHLLVGAMAHPLNRPLWSASAGRVVHGYTFLQPRVGITMPSANRSLYARLFSGEPGIDPYTQAVSDVYQDIFAEGSFVGKGIYDVDAMRQSCTDRFPENRVLSHDLLECAHGRAALVSDVILYEDYPAVHSADVNRHSRWIRGDWQIARWVLGRVPGGDGGTVANPISRLSRLKVLDNLRRSLVPIAMVSLLALGWAMPEVTPLATGTVLATLFLPGVLASTAALARKSRDIAFHHHVREVGRAALRTLSREGLNLAWLPYSAAVHAAAIARTAFRLLISRRRLLEWRTAADAVRAARSSYLGAYASMWMQPLMAALGAALLVAGHSPALPWAAPILVLWLVGPAASAWLSAPRRVAVERLAEHDLAFLRGVARRTWRFFEVATTEADHWLPPDNIQVDPPVGVAHRTSPTNIGCALLSALGAYDLGYIAGDELIARTSRTLATLDRLPRHRGHFYNWYDTRTLEPLRPMYVSTVDSGNLSGFLLTLAAGLDALGDRPIVRAETFNGIADALSVLRDLGGGVDLSRMRQALDSAPQGTVRSLAQARRALEVLATEARHVRDSIEARRAPSAAAGSPDVAHLGDLVWWAHAIESQAGSALAELDALAPWCAAPSQQCLGPAAELADALDQVRTLSETARLEATLSPAIDRALDRTTAVGFRAAVIAAAERATLRLADARQLASRAAEFAEADVEFLYDRKRHLFSIGYSVTDHRLDAGYYDLLASEARLASYVAIARGHVPQKHWFHLGRQLTAVGGVPALLSWSGSMFEYLMPMLVMPTHPGTLLDITCRAVVARHIEYGREHGIPWGVSESGYNKTDGHLNYQYKAFGVPGLGFKRGLADELVVAPYASAMALMVSPMAACANLQRLAREGRLGPLGFFEAVDYTQSRVPRGRASVTVKSYMAHHQGMAFLALTHILADRPMQRRFASDPALRASDLLLQERLPRAPAIFPHPAEVSAVRATSEVEHQLRVYTTPSTPAPEVCLLSNGRYHVTVTNAGGGASRCGDVAVTRWHEDPTRDSWGLFCYMRDTESGAFWSCAHQPTLVPADSYEAVFSPGRAEFRRRDSYIDTHVEICVSPEDDIELRQLTITNRGRKARTIELTTYAEVVLATAAADAAHPAFSKLFVQTELVRQHQAILFTRRPRSAGEHPPWGIHLVTVHGELAATTTYETSRAAFLGRCATPADPAAMHRATLGDSEGSVLDPIVAIRVTVTVPPDGEVRAHIVTGMAKDRAGAMALVEKYTDRHLAARVLDLSWAQNQLLQRQLDASPAEINLFDQLAGHMLYLNSSLRAAGSVIARNSSGQSGLWAYGISGDLPILLVRVSGADGIPLVRQIIRAHAYWRLKGLSADLVIWNEDPSGYRQDLHEQITGVIATLVESSTVDRPGGIFVRRNDQMSQEDSVLMQTVARVVLSDSAGTLAEQMTRRPRAEPRVPLLTADRAELRASVAPIPTAGGTAHSAPSPTLAPPVSPPSADQTDRPDLVAFNGLGGFTADGREYVVVTSGASRTPAPWSNVIANPYFGTVVSESGGAYTWWENAHAHRITPWHNDPVSDASGEAMYLRDEDNGAFWSPTPLPAGGQGSYTTRHGFGYSVFEHSESGISTTLRTYVAIDAPVKFLVVRLRNRSGRNRRLSLTGVFEMVLGSQRAAMLPHIVTEVDLKTGALMARNPYAGEFAARVAFLDCSEVSRTVSGDRYEIIGRNGTLSRPRALGHARLSGKVGPGLDACLAMQVRVDLADGQDHEVAFMLGSGRSLDDARHLVNRFRGTSAARSALEEVWKHWNRTLGAVNVQTPDAGLNFLANGWLVYQTLACRMWARSGYYQSGGAFGYRDQLQDSAALLHAEPTVLREHIIRSAAHQFVEGDAQHWWHPPLDRGVRTRISDDYLFLPSVVSRYVEGTGDTGVLDEVVPFIEGRPVSADEDSYYDLPTRSASSGTVYEHCVRAIRHGCRFGTHGLPLMGCGDWNDAMNLVGDKGRGESVWLAFFLLDTLRRFGAIARQRNDGALADECSRQADRLRASIDEHAWDGAWYRRAYDDEGRPLGASGNDACAIDSLPQSWAALTGAVSPDRTKLALDSLHARLVDPVLGVIRLFDPPFDRTDADPGYVKGYVPGVRENGGQYTHAAVWAAMGFAAARDAKRAWQAFNIISPINHGRSAQAIAAYKVEPYVVAADVYTNPQHAGRGGWTWYTGSAGWMYRLILESLLGLRLEVDRLRIEPLIPSDWPGFDVHYRWRDTVHHIHVVNQGGGHAVPRVVSDGAERPDRTIPLHQDGREHWSEVTVGEPSR